MGGVASFPERSDVSRETLDRFMLLEHMVKKWNPVINLVSKDSLGQIRSRHINDSMQVFKLVKFEQGTWCDLGSGGGFPGLVVGILAQDSDRAVEVKLVESDGRKAAFLHEAVRQLDIHATVVHGRIEDLAPLSATILSARALAGLSKLCEFSQRHLSRDGVALFPKGANHKQEIEDARASWSFDLTLHPSITDSTAAILELRNIRHV